MREATETAFLDALHFVQDEGRMLFGVGTLSEKTTHAVLKHTYEPDPSRHEIPVFGSVADIFTGSEIIEIQSANFSALKKKLDKFLPLLPVTVVYPVPHAKWMHWIDPQTGEVCAKHKSPKAGTPYEIFRQLVYIMPYLTDPNLHLCITLLDVDEYRLLDGYGRDKKRGSHRYDRIPKALAGEVRIDCPQDYLQFVPYALPQTFTAKEFAAAARLRGRLGQNAVAVLRSVGVLVQVGKRGNAFLYEVREDF